ncbi:hypothetical protein [Streptomyces sp. NPDC002403]
MRLILGGARYGDAGWQRCFRLAQQRVQAGGPVPAAAGVVAQGEDLERGERAAARTGIVPVQVGDHGKGYLARPPCSKPTEMAHRWMDYLLGGSAGDGAPPQFDVRSE